MKVFKYINGYKPTEDSQENTQDIDRGELMSKMMKQLEDIQAEREALKKQLEEAESKQRKELADKKAEDQLKAIAKALNIPGA